jgi:hypothetical protein
MRRPLKYFAIVTALIVTTAPPSRACGDKFVIFGRGVRFRAVYAAAHPAAILVYMNPMSHVPLIDRDYHLVAALRLAGHRPSVVETRDELRDALTSASYDVLIADLEDAAGLETVVRQAASPPTVLPLVYKASGAEFAELAKKYSCLLKADRRNHQLLTVLDEVMRSKSAGQKPSCNVSV